MTHAARRALSALTAAALLAGLFLGAPASVRATPETYYVGHLVNDYAPGSECANPDYWTDGDWTGGGEYDSDNDAIQDAADNAASGSVIYICAGTYVFAEQVTVGAGKSLTFRGDGSATVLDGNDITRIFNASPVGESDQGGVLSLRDLLIMDAKITEWNGGAIESDGLSLNNVTITGSTGAYNGGALYAEGNVTIMDSTFTDNISIADGGVLYAWGGVPVSISNSVFDGSTAGFTGAGGAIVAATVSVTNSTFTGSHAYYGGAIYAYTTATVTGSTFTNNDAFNGGAISTTTATVTGSTFTDNTANVGGAINADTTATVTSSTFTDNDATVSGAISATTATVTNSAFTDNDAGILGGAIYANTTATVTDSTFTNNTAGSEGGAIDATIATVTGSTFRNNSGDYGGAINADIATVTDSAFTKNTVTVYGGAIYANTATVSSSSFTDNEADVEGGAILAGPGTIITRSRFTRNTAGEHGGAMLLYAPNSADLQQLRGNTFMRNTAPAGGAITLGPCTVPSRSEATRVERANRFSGNRATEQRRTQNIERWEGGCG